MEKLGGEVYSFTFPADREKFRALVKRELDQLLGPRVCPKCFSPYWNSDRVRVATGIAAQPGRKTVEEPVTAA